MKHEAADSAIQDGGEPDGEENDDAAPVAQEPMICPMINEAKIDWPKERLLHSLVEQIQREYRVEMADTPGRIFSRSAARIDNKWRDVTAMISSGSVGGRVIERGAVRCRFVAECTMSAPRGPA